MIFVSVGTENFQFDRLLECIDKGIESRDIEGTVFAQTGCSGYRPRHYQFKDYIAYDEMVENIELADIVIMHAGIGSTLLCLELGKVPILLPRMYEKNEHLDDHQLEFSKKFQTVKKAIVVYNEEELLFAIKNYHNLVNDIKNNKTSGVDRLRLDEHLTGLLG
ncbi:MAG: multidrug MFS transporter [Nitrospinaceae bacterium]|nr:MAG: multidrug MFS transporter [Nitrospinaceae bacterium]